MIQQPSSSTSLLMNYPTTVTSSSASTAATAAPPQPTSIHMSHWVPPFKYSYQQRYHLYQNETQLPFFYNSSNNNNNNITHVNHLNHTHTPAPTPMRVPTMYNTLHSNQPSTNIRQLLSTIPANPQNIVHKLRPYKPKFTPEERLAISKQFRENLILSPDNSTNNSNNNNNNNSIQNEKTAAGSLCNNSLSIPHHHEETPHIYGKNISSAGLFKSLAQDVNSSSSYYKPPGDIAPDRNKTKNKEKVIEIGSSADEGNNLNEERKNSDSEVLFYEKPARAMSPMRATSSSFNQFDTDDYLNFGQEVGFGDDHVVGNEIYCSEESEKAKQKTLNKHYTLGDRQNRTKKYRKKRKQSSPLAYYDESSNLSSDELYEPNIAPYSPEYYESELFSDLDNDLENEILSLKSNLPPVRKVSPKKQSLKKKQYPNNRKNHPLIANENHINAILAADKHKTKRKRKTFDESTSEDYFDEDYNPMDTDVLDEEDIKEVKKRNKKKKKNASSASNRSTTNMNANNAENPPKRKRGRPPLSKNKQTVSEKQSNGSSKNPIGETSTSLTANPLGVPTRKRGRPPLSENKTMESNERHSDLDDKKQSRPDITENPPKRKRGRPPLSKNKQTVSERQSNVSPKKKRGRPPAKWKKSTEESSDEEYIPSDEISEEEFDSDLELSSSDNHSAFNTARQLNFDNTNISSSESSE
jgi:hypothetical protein